MHIVMLCQVLFRDTIGGAGRYLLMLAHGLQARGHEVTILAPQVGQATQRDESRDGVRILRYGPLRSLWHLPGAFQMIRRAFRRLQKESPIDLVGVHQPLAALSLLGEARDIPWVYHFQSPWEDESRLMRPRAAWDLLGLAALRLRRGIEHRVLQRARAVVTLSRAMQVLLLRRHGRIPAELRVVPGCVEVDRFTPIGQGTSDLRKHLGLPTDAQVLLTVRNLVPRMNLDGLIRAMRRIAEQRPKTVLVIAGHGPLAGALRRLVVSLGLEDHVRLIGAVPDEELVRWYQAATLFVMPSRALEGFGLATLEALACGTPVVGTPVGGTRELLEPLDPTCLSESADPEALADAILRMLRRLEDPAVRHAFSARCRAYASALDLATMAGRIEQVYREARRIRILHVHTLPIVSGSGLNTFLSMAGLPRERYDVELACAPGGRLLELVAGQGLQVHSLRHMVWAIRPIKDVLVVLELWRLIRTRRYEIVHTHNSKAGFVGRLAARLARVPVIVHTVHGFAFHAQEPRWRQFSYRVLERLGAWWCDRLVMISQPLIDWAVEARIAPRTKCVKVYSGIDVHAFRVRQANASLRAELGFRDHEFVVGEVAKLWRGKGHEVLLRAAASLKERIPELRLLIVGEGGLQNDLARLAKELGLADRIVFTGFRQDVPAVTHSLDVAVLPSLFEGMGRAVLEAQAAGKPVVASRVGGIPDLIADGKTGLLIEPGNVAHLADALLRLYEQPRLRQELGAQAQQAVVERFDAATMVRQLQGLYEALLQEWRAGRT